MDERHLGEQESEEGRRCLGRISTASVAELLTLDAFHKFSADTFYASWQTEWINHGTSQLVTQKNIESWTIGGVNVGNIILFTL